MLTRARHCRVAVDLSVHPAERYRRKQTHEVRPRWPPAPHRAPSPNRRRAVMRSRARRLTRCEGMSHGPRSSAASRWRCPSTRGAASMPARGLPSRLPPRQARRSRQRMRPVVCVPSGGVGPQPGGVRPRVARRPGPPLRCDGELLLCTVDGIAIRVLASDPRLSPARLRALLSEAVDAVLGCRDRPGGGAG